MMIMPNISLPQQITPLLSPPLPPPPSKATKSLLLNPTPKTSYLVKLAGPIDTPSTIQYLAGLTEPPKMHKGVGEAGQTALFCLISGTTKRSLLASLASLADESNPTFVRINRAHKDLSSYSAAPTLGFDGDPTLPQFRPTGPSYTYLPAQSQYPVWYFFYGTLADPDILGAKLSLAERPVLIQAVVRGGLVKMWGGKYKALVDRPLSAVVDGWAYEVMSEEDEEQLRYYETDQYEVVRCEIEMMNSTARIKGLTFRFLGDVG